MSSTEALNAKHVRVSGVLSIIGLLLVVLSLVWDSPISTYVIIYVGAAFVLAGAGPHYPFPSASAHVSSADHDLHFLL